MPRLAIVRPSAAPVWALALSCCAGPPASTTPEGAIAAYAQALERGDAHAVRALLHEPGTAEADPQQLARYPEEIRELGRSLASPVQRVTERAEVTLRDGQRVRLVRGRDGLWNIQSPPPTLYDQSTPRRALRSFVRAMRRRRWDVVWKLMPEAAQQGVTPEQLGRNLQEQRQQWERMLALLETSLDSSIEVAGDRATMAYGDRFAVRFVREEGLWKIEDPE